MRTTINLALAAALVSTVLAANAALEAWGTIPVGFGLSAPAGVLFAGLAFGLRDALHENGTRWWVLAAILAGSALSYAISDGSSIPGGHASIAVASAAAFLLSELADFAVYSPLRARRWGVAVVASNLAGAVVDSALFLWLAFGSLDLIAGQVLGKAYMILPALVIVWAIRAEPWDRDPCWACDGATDDTDWKLSTDALAIAHEAQHRGIPVHMGRVNSLRRMRRAAEMLVDSADGTFLKHGPPEEMADRLAVMLAAVNTPDGNQLALA